MGGQTDSQVGSQVHGSRKKSWISRIYSWLAIGNLCRLALGGQTVKNLRRFASTCIRIWARPKSINAGHRKSTQVGGKTKRKLNARPAALYLKCSWYAYSQLPLNGHLVIKADTSLKQTGWVGPCRTSVIYFISLQADASLSRTVGAGTERVRLRASWLYTVSSNPFIFSELGLVAFTLAPVKRSWYGVYRFVYQGGIVRQTTSLGRSSTVLWLAEAKRNTAFALASFLLFNRIP